MATIVVMDDDPVVRNVVERTLNIDGHDVLAFPDAQPVLDGVDFQNIDLIVTDLSMPTPGEVAIRTLRHRGITVPILVLSGYLDDQKKDYLLKLGAQGVMTKPFLLKALLAQVRVLLAQKRMS
jgi:DNA-binding response OmpR family regulator